ncbi:uncharacterized protein LOC129742394 [Uranotaenia lowii]|uniref:uncharacterized protein LOC129742394 n=1 Tax=Uranotaenia lowii TaxID=190385 RepID=UPI0024797138|nr:uncharacterized protein LOC129742394 [Uranotaenia lowii]
MASASGGPRDGPIGRRFPSFMDQNKEFGRIIILQMTGIDGHILPKNPFIIGESIEKAVGSVESAYSEAQGTKYTIKTRKQEQVDKLLALQCLLDGTKITIKYHPTLNSCKCVISSYDLIEMNVTEIQEQLANQNVSEVRRIIRKQDNLKVNTSTLILTFKQTTYPEYVKVGLLRVATRTYYPNPMLCYECFEYGHSSKHCKGPKRCFNCSAEHPMTNPDETDSTEQPECKKPQFCRNCEGEHRPGNKKCEVYQKEAKIVKVRIDSNITYAEARKRVESGQNSYAQATAQNRKDSIKFDELIKENRRKDELIANLTNNNKQQSMQIERLLNEIQNLREDLSVRYVNSNIQTTPNNDTMDRTRSRSRTVNPDKFEQRNEIKRNRGISQRRVATSISPPMKKTTHMTNKDQENTETVSRQMDMYTSDTETPEQTPRTPHGGPNEKNKQRST